MGKPCTGKCCYDPLQAKVGHLVEDLKALREFYECETVSELRARYVSNFYDPQIESYLYVVRNDPNYSPLAFAVGQEIDMTIAIRDRTAEKEERGWALTGRDLIEVILKHSR